MHSDGWFNFVVRELIGVFTVAVIVGAGVKVHRAGAILPMWPCCRRRERAGAGQGLIWEQLSYCTRSQARTPSYLIHSHTLLVLGTIGRVLTAACCADTLGLMN